MCPKKTTLMIVGEVGDAGSIRAAARNMKPPPSTCRAQSILSVAKKRSATIPTKNGETMQASGPTAYVQPRSPPVKPILTRYRGAPTYQAPQTKNCKNIIAPRRAEVPASIDLS